MVRLTEASYPPKEADARQHVVHPVIKVAMTYRAISALVPESRFGGSAMAAAASAQ
jgi:hypothetical protein